MRKELPHFNIGNSYGGNQEWFRTFMMRLGGCGAETACDCSIYFAREFGIGGIYPYDANNLSRGDYVDFGHLMERYLWPRRSGINTLDIYIDGYNKYLEDSSVKGLTLRGFPGERPYEEAAEVLRQQIDAGYPVPTLVLRHSMRRYRDYVWHWFILNGYDTGRAAAACAAPASPEAGLRPAAPPMLVKAVTYSEYQWLNFSELWNTGYSERGGLILFDLQ